MIGAVASCTPRLIAAARPRVSCREDEGGVSRVWKSNIPNSTQPWHDEQTHRTFLRPDSGKCLHYYFYFMDADLDLRGHLWSG